MSNKCTYVAIVGAIVWGIIAKIINDNLIKKIHSDIILYIDDYASKSEGQNTKIIIYNTANKIIRVLIMLILIFIGYGATYKICNKN